LQTEIIILTLLIGLGRLEVSKRKKVEKVVLAGTIEMNSHIFQDVNKMLPSKQLLVERERESEGGGGQNIVL
jgi:hydrogenase maturation factor HypF (carbamoyltransferase family)